MNFADLYPGETCMVIGNGPSLNEVPAALLRKYRTFGTNRIYLLDGFLPSFYVAIDPLAIEGHTEQINALPCPKFIRWTLADQIPGSYPLKKTTSVPFSTDIAQGVNEGWTVVFACLQIAYWMGFTTALLVGVDHRNYERSGAIDPNHFSPQYTLPDEPYHLHIERMEAAYRAAQEYYTKAGRKIINLTPGTALDVFPKDDWRKWL